MKNSNGDMDNKSLQCAGNRDIWAHDTMELTINPTDICNFKCKYCCNRSSREHNILDKNILRDFISDLALKNKERYIFRITGGEPLLYPHMDEMARMIAELVPGEKKIKFITNGSLIHKEHANLKKYSTDIKIEYVISLHLDEINIDNFIKNLKTIQDTGNILCKMLINPGMLETYKDIYTIFNDMGIRVITDGLFDDSHDPMAYTPEEKDFINKHGLQEHFIFHKYADTQNGTYIRDVSAFDKRFYPDIHSYKGMRCCAGLNTLHLNPRGILIPCFGLAYKLGKKYDLNKTRLKDLEELAMPPICQVDRCVCGQFIKTPKWRGKDNMPKYLRQ